jgi:hypothetical protein
MHAAGFLERSGRCGCLLGASGGLTCMPFSRMACLPLPLQHPLAPVALADPPWLVASQCHASCSCMQLHLHGSTACTELACHCLACPQSDDTEQLLLDKAGCCSGTDKAGQEEGGGSGDHRQPLQDKGWGKGEGVPGTRQPRQVLPWHTGVQGRPGG